MSSSEIDALQEYSRSLSSLPSSPLSSTYSNSAQYTLSSSMASMTLSGNGVKSTTGSQCSSKSHSPAGSITSTLTLTGRQDEITTPNSGSDCGDLREDKQVNFKVKCCSLDLDLELSLILCRGQNLLQQQIWIAQMTKSTTAPLRWSRQS